MEKLLEQILEVCCVIFPVLIREIIARRKHPISLPVIFPIEEKVLTSKQAANFLNVNVPTLDALTKSGSLKHCRIGNEKRYLLSDLLIYLKRKPLNQSD